MDLPVVPLGTPRAERADATRNREHLLDVARDMVAEHGVEQVTMDGLAERAGLGKGTVFRRFGTRAGIFHALLDSDERAFQQDVLAGPPPLGPGADPVQRLIAYGRARTTFLLGHRAIASVALGRSQLLPAGAMSGVHIRMLLGLARPDIADLDTLSLQLTAALEGPLLLYMARSGPAETPPSASALADSWQALIERLCRPGS